MSKDQRPPPDGRSDRLAPRHWSLRTKLAIVLLVPAALAVVLGGLRIADRTAQAGELDRVSRFVAAQGEVAALLERLQVERLRATEYVVTGRAGDVSALEQAGVAVDDAAAAARPTVQALYPDDQRLVGEHQQADQALARLAGARSLVTTSNAPASAVIVRYDDLIAAIVELDNALLRGVNRTQLNGLTTALAGLAAARNDASLQEALMVVAARNAGPDMVELHSSHARLQQSLGEFRGALDVDQRVRYATLIAGPANADRTTMVTGVVAGSLRPGPGSFDERSVQLLYGAFLGELDQAEDGVRNELTGGITADRESAVTLAAVDAAVLVAVLVVGALVVGLITRQLSGSLRTLRRGALEVADARLPEAVARMREGAVPDTEIVPVPVGTREEIGEVARAFDAVHAQALRLAADQATLQADVNAMFVNLSRRSQTLLDRQLKLIEELEAGEADPVQLAKLFRLDHLASRMRRNSANLLVLAGTDAAPPAGRPVPAVELLQASLSEVEQYQRVVVEPPPELAVNGRVSNDLLHLLAELLENATNFSPPESRVLMSTSRTADGAFLVEIADDGPGIPAGELARLNDQLRHTGDVTVEASRQMGLFVVGTLAARHGIDVGLFAGSSVAGEEPGTGRTGLTARVWVPRQLLTDGSAAQQHGEHPSGLPRRLAGQCEAETRAEAGAAAALPSLPALVPNPDAAPLPVRRPWPATAETAALAEPGTGQGVPAQRPPLADPVPVQHVPVEPWRPPAAEPVVPVQRGVPQDPAPEVVELPASSTDALGLFDAATPPAPLPDPFAEERPRDPFALPMDVPGTPTVTEVASGWFRSHPPSRRSTAHPQPVAADADAGHGPSWEQPNTDLGVQDMAGREQWDADREASAGRPVPRAWGPPPQQARPPARPWTDEPWGAGSDEPATEAASAAQVQPRPAPIPRAYRTPENGGYESGQESSTPEYAPAAGYGPERAYGEEFVTGADAGWRAAEAIGGQEVPTEVTAAGLPRRTPLARLVPGSAAASEPTHRSTRRDAEAVRGRLASYQRGVRSGREDRERSADGEHHPGGEYGGQAQ